MKNVIAKYTYLLSQKIYGENVVEDLKELQASGHLPAEDIRTLQLKKIQRLLSFLYEKNEYYSSVMKKYGIHPRDIKSLDDFKAFPTLVKENIRTEQKAMVSQLRCRKEHRHTSGTTGDSLQFVKSKRSTSIMRALDYRCLAWHGINMGDRQARFWGTGLTQSENVSQAIKDYLLNRLRCSVFKLTEQGMEDIYRKLLKFKPDYIYGYVSGIYEFSRYCLEHNLELPNVKGIIVTSEMLYRHQQEMMTNAFHSSVIREYGSTEFGIIAFECPQGTLHIMDENVFVETEDGQDGMPGELIITELNNFLMPFVRYKIGDVGTLKKQNRCTCGLGLSTMQNIEGRNCSFFQTSSGHLVYENIFDFINLIHGVEQMKVSLVAQNRLIISLKGNHINSEDLEKCRVQLSPFLGKDVDIQFKFVDDILRDKSGKRNYFESLI